MRTGISSTSRGYRGYRGTEPIVPEGNQDPESSTVIGDIEVLGGQTMNQDGGYRVTPIIAKIKTLCGFSDDSTMARFVFQ
jgi:hypothetical protein